MINLPELKLGIIAVSRDCFPLTLSEQRRKAVVKACEAKGLAIREITSIIEKEQDLSSAFREIEEKEVNALVIYLGNFGPEGPETLLAQKFNGPTMFAAAAEESKSILSNERGDAYCGMLNASYNLALRKVRAYIPHYPVGTAEEIADMAAGFSAVARTIIALKKLKIISFGPRPFDFLACNAPIKPLYDLGIEIMENSELDLFDSFNKHEGDTRIPAVLKEMEKELGSNNKYAGILPKLAQYELTLQDWMENNLGNSEYAVFANKCWPAFQTQFGFVPCYVNSRFASRGIPIACETDIYGALSEYIVTAATDLPATLLDINNTVPQDLYEGNSSVTAGYKPNELFMGFHCGNTPSCFMTNYDMKYQLIMHRLLEPDQNPTITRGTLEGRIRPGGITIFRLQGTADCQLRSYIAQGEVLDMEHASFGGTGVFAISEMPRFYRYVLIGKNYPHHTAVAFKHAGKSLFAIMKMLGVDEVDFNRPPTMLYDNETPFSV